MAEKIFFDAEAFLESIAPMLDAHAWQDLKRALAALEPIDLADVFVRVDEALRPRVFRLLPKDTAAQMFVELPSDEQEKLIGQFTDAEITFLLDELYYDDTADLVEEMPAGVVDRLLRAANDETRRVVNELLRYPPNSAGSIMTTEYLRFSPDMTVADALAHIRLVADAKETIYTGYVTDRHLLIGIVSVRDLLTNDPSTPLRSIMERDVIAARVRDDREDVALQFERYGFSTLPVTDDEGRMVGIVTFDDIVDVIRQETEEDFSKMAAITPNDVPYLKTPVLRLFRTRIPWLLLLMISATFTGAIIGIFENALAAQIALTSFIPMLMDTGGNSGSQASVTIIRALSRGEVKTTDVFRVLWKESRVAVLCGVTLAGATFLKILLFDNLLFGAGVPTAVAAVVCLTLGATVLCAKWIGGLLPLLAERLGFDPAVMASPFITTIVDAVSLSLYFALATLLL